MHTIRAAIATDDGKTCIDRHFGDAGYYDLYDIDETGFRYVTRLENTVDIKEEDSTHGNPKKASGIGSLLKRQQVNTAVAKVFGPNITRLVKYHACVLVGTDDIHEVLDILMQEHGQVREEIEKGEQRQPVDLRKRV
jgi:predicted Fe-Mo cluster-binding NifX family protein